MSDGPIALDRLQASRQRLASRLDRRHSAWPAGAVLGAQAADSLLRPLAREHPFGLAACAFAGGAALVAIRPWRAVTGSPWLSHLATSCAEQWASQLPLSAVLAAVQDAALSYIATSAAPMPPPDGAA